MGTGLSAHPYLQSMPKQNWEEVQHSFPANRPVQYGKCKFYFNTLTFEEIQQYSLHFQSNQECEDYLLLFRKRLKDEHIVNARFIDLQNTHLCGCGKVANIYLQNIPIRLNEIKNIQEQDFLYVLLNTLKGFQKLYGFRGYFKPSEELVGFDRQGRLKVWLNPNFSKAYVNSPITDVSTKLTEIYQTDYEQRMVWQIIEMVEAKAPDQNAFHRYQKIFMRRQEEQQKLTFDWAKKTLSQYAKSRGIQIKQYFDTIIPLIRHINQSSQQMIAEGSSVDFQGISFRPIKRKNKIIYYVNPYQESQGSSSQSDVSEHLPFRAQLEDNTSFHKSSIVSVDRVPANTLSHVNYDINMKNENRVYSQQEQLYSSRNIPRIKFNYNNYMGNLPTNVSQPHYYSTAESFSHVGGSRKEYTVNFPLEVIAEKREKTEKEKSSVFSRKIIYNGVYQQFELDQQIKKDLMKLNKK